MATNSTFTITALRAVTSETYLAVFS
jgi:hypothetical protein